MNKTKDFFKKYRFLLFFLIGVIFIIFVSVVGFAAGLSLDKLKADYPLKPLATYINQLTDSFLKSRNIEIENPASENQEYVPQTSQEQAVINVVKDYSPAVVSIIVSKDLPVIEEYYVSPFDGFFNDPFFQIQIPQYRQIGTEKKEIGGGSGFIVSSDGIVITNKHVVLDASAEYTVITTDGRKFPAKVLAKDPAQDLAVLKIEKEKVTDDSGNLSDKPFSVVKLGDSSKLEIGQTVIAIGNALGEYRNTISVGVVSGLGRTITASGGGLVETLEDVIQTDAAINKGNSGGPLLNLRGEVIGINTATVLDAQNIGFAIPINLAKRNINQAIASGKISYPFLGVRLVTITDQVQKDNNLPVNYGAWITSGSQKGEVAVVPGSAADKAGIKDKDIILEVNGQKVTAENTLLEIIQDYNPGQVVKMKVLSQGQEKIIDVTLGERTE
ncbi:trypsin-like peptidase domain-containing protein [Candidatus Parcubacteria bacterium]|nr:trypsin-like peptidase domain-containing protein [Patescibacteria group bacterium]MBU4467048.1 trypsin-like peptidase domain-containing protein [Patescibacteria group bacterium]MCG2688396.1 trypsin-like peptidase domain-containing protein [Candidatus Parcubacteria bacterium]